MRSNQQAPITINHNKQITKIKFNQDGVHPFLKGMCTWSDIPALAIITAPNGSGKSRLLSYIHDFYDKKNGNVIFIESQKLYNVANARVNFKQPHYFPNYPADFLDNMLKAIRNRYNPGPTLISIDSLPNRLNKVSKITDFLSKHQDFFNKLIKDLESDKVDIATIDDETLKRRIQETCYTLQDYQIQNFNLSDPVYFIREVFIRFRTTRQHYISEYCGAHNILNLFEFYNSNNQQELSLLEFMKKISDRQSSFLANLATNYVDEKILIKTPWEEINSILERYGFTYRISFNPGDNGFSHNDEKLVTFYRNDTRKIIKTNDLSSGERVILDIFLWQYYHLGLTDKPDTTNSKLITKANIMLLDEPDASLDPKLSKIFFEVVYNVYIKQGIQVIMTTHRIDTIALVPDHDNNVGIFTMINKHDKKEIALCHKILAKLRLTRNLREFAIPIRVYTESFNDAKFYQSIHSFLVSKRGEERREGAIFRHSRRYRPEFYSTCIDSGWGGGLDSVIDLTIKESTSHDKRKSFSGSQLPGSIIKPFGIIDLDIERNKDGSEKDSSKKELDKKLESDKHGSLNHRNQLKERFIIISRYTLENFLYDPFILCSIFDKQDLEKIANKSIRQKIIECKDLYDNEDEECLKKCSEFLFLLPEIHGKIKSKTKILSIIESFLLNGQGSDETGLTEKQIGQRRKEIKDLYAKAGLIEEIKETNSKSTFCIKKHFKDQFLNILSSYQEEESIEKIAEIIIEKISNQNPENPDLKNIDQESLKNQLVQKIKDKNKDKKSDQLPDLEFTETKEVKLFFGKVTGYCQYPRSFLETPGHDIEKAFATIEDQEDLKQEDQLVFNKAMILDQIRQADNICLPEDLIGAFDELDGRMRSQVRLVIKPDNSVAMQI
jgi:energy-coupling factor transporter ATP-binding protein EcfA2